MEDKERLKEGIGATVVKLLCNEITLSLLKKFFKYFKEIYINANQSLLKGSLD